MSNYRTAIGEKLLIRPETLSSPVTYEIIDIESVDETVIQTGTVSGAYLEIDVLWATFLAYRGKTLLLRLTSGANVEESLFLVSGLYDLRPDLQLILGLLGENRKETHTDYQEGYLRTATIQIYTDETLATLREDWDFVKRYVANFTPDWRFHILHEKVTD